MQKRAAYCDLLESGQFAERVALARERLRRCQVCPRHCAVDRLEGEFGICQVGAQPFVASYAPHFGEEQPLRGRNGSGTIFFGSCNLRCVYCQNYEISHLKEGKEFPPSQLAEAMLSLQEQGCHNVNLVTPSHQVPQILEGLLLAAEQGLSIPIVYNTSSYDDLDTLKLLDGIVDIYLPDFKYSDADVALRYSKIESYPDIAKTAFREMHRQVGDLTLDAQGIAVRGLLVRHLVLPGGLAGTAEIMKFLAEEISIDTYVNVMSQYRPCYRAFRYPPLDRRITEEEYEDAIKLAQDNGLHRLHSEKPGSAIAWMAEL
ncbi:MAG: 4Fe-4S cluster-binding domain-containing protein [Nitrospirota bacterium]|nr:MAG: 4Fe-4S cluster-binding domain-containing protein [Nitrospirota bacterium]